MDRRIVLNTVKNMRDLGGIAMKDSRMIIRPGMLYRSAFLYQASPADLAEMRDELHIRKVVDLRTDQEVAKMPDEGADGIVYTHRPLLNESMMGITHEIRLESENRSVMLPDMQDMYRQIVTDKTAQRNLGRAVSEIMTHDYDQGGVVWHCTEGKDRCGITSAVVLMTRGADRDTVMRDYLITNETNAAKAEGYYRYILSKGEEERIAAFVRDAFLAKEEYLNAALDAIFAAFGNMEEYAEAALGIPEKVLQRFRETVLTKADPS